MVDDKEIIRCLIRDLGSARAAVRYCRNIASSQYQRIADTLEEMIGMKPIPQQQLTNARIMERIAKVMREHGGDERMAAHYERRAKCVRRMALRALRQG